jgi:hypothetical protein
MFNKFLTLFIVSISCVLAHDDDRLNTVGDPKPSPTIVQIVKQQPEVIQHYDRVEKKLYLKTEKIFHTNGGLALYNGNSTILLPSLSVDHMGYYVSCRHWDDTKPLTCPNCGLRFYFSDNDWSDLCPLCQIPGV